MLAGKIAPGQVVKSINGLEDSVTLAAGNNVTITPSGNTLTVAATDTGISVVSHDATLTGNGTGGSPLGIAVPLTLSGQVAGSLSPIVTVHNTAEDSINTGILSRASYGVYGWSTHPQGSGLYGQGANSTETFGTGGVGMSAFGGQGIVRGGGVGSNGGDGIKALGGKGSNAGLGHPPGVGGTGVSGTGGDSGVGPGELAVGGIGVKGIGGNGGTDEGGTGIGGIGVKGIGGMKNGTGVLGQGIDAGDGVQGTSPDGIGVHGISTGSGKAGKFDGPVQITGILDVAAAGIRFPANIANVGGSGDQAKIFVQADGNEKTSLVIENQNDGVGATIEDNIRLKAANVIIEANNDGGGGGGGNLVVTGSYTGCTTAPSDRHLKTNFSLVDTRSILDRVAQLPIQRWSYKQDAKGTLHIGPMAQDFRAAFNVGVGDRHIDLIDANGVTMAAIQALYQMAQDKDRQIKEQSRQIAELQAQVSQLKSAVQKKRRIKRN